MLWQEHESAEGLASIGEVAHLQHWNKEDSSADMRQTHELFARHSEMKCGIQRRLVQLPHIQADPYALSVSASYSLNMNNEPTLAESADNPPSECSDDQKYSSAVANGLQADINAALLELK